MPGSADRGGGRAFVTGGLGARLSAWFGRAPAPVPETPRDVSARPDTPIMPPVRDTGFACYRVRAAEGGWVTAQPDMAELTTRADQDPAYGVIAVLPVGLPGVCFLLAPDLRAIELREDGLRGAAISARVLQTTAPGVVRIRYPLGGARFLTLDGAGLRFDGDGGSMLAAFCLVPLGQSEVPAGLRLTAEEIGVAAGHGLAAGALLHLLRTGAVRPELAAALLRVMPREEMEELARLVLDRPSELALLRRVLPGDPWAERHLPALAGWRAERPRVPGGIGHSPASDETPMLPTCGTGPVTLGLALQGLARRSTLPRRGACVLAAARNEGAYLLDWISYHLSVGFEHVFLYVNENEDGSDELLELLAGQGVITLVRNERTARIGPQLKGYTHALTMLPQILDYRWAAVLDVDEYFAFDPGTFAGVGDFLGLQECQPVDAVALSWAMFAGLPGETWRDASTLARFTRRQRAVSPLVKSIIRPRLFWYSQPHFPTAILDEPFDYRLADGSLHYHPLSPGEGAAVSRRPSADQAWVNHYMLRTAEEALWKWARGRGDLEAARPDAMRPLQFIADHFLGLAQPERLVEDRRILDCARGQPAVLRRLLGLPGVAECDARIKAGFAAQLARSREAFLATALPPDAPETVRCFRDIVATERLAA